MKKLTLLLAVALVFSLAAPTISSARNFHHHSFGHRHFSGHHHGFKHGFHRGFHHGFSHRFHHPGSFAVFAPYFYTSPYYSSYPYYYYPYPFFSFGIVIR